MPPLKKLSRASGSTAHPVRILQFGEGNFLRAFVDWIVEIMNEKADFNASVQVVQPIEKGLGELVNQQGGLYHVVLNGLQNQKPAREIRLIKCLKDVVNPYANYRSYLGLAENKDLRFIISNTTEAGIEFIQETFDPEKPARGFPGKLTALLFHRFKFFGGTSQSGLILLPCELVEKNGVLLKKAVLQYAEHWKLPDDFRNWINDCNVFCNTLVDRIVPGFPKETIQSIQDETGYEDNLVVMAEPFHLWVIEGPQSVRKAWPAETAGLQVKFVDDLTPYRTRKVRILNGAHTAMVPLAYLRGLRTVRETIEDPYMSKFVRSIVYDEIIPTLDLPKEELTRFADDVMERFQNPFIKHELSSIALNSISKFKVRVLPSLLEYVERKKQLPVNLVYSMAALIRFYSGPWRGENLPVSDSPEITAFFAGLQGERDKSLAVNKILSQTSFWDQDLSSLQELNQALTASLNEIESHEKANTSAGH